MRESYFAEYMFAFFLFMPMIVKPVSQPTGYNGLILFIISLICIFCQLVHNFKTHKKINYTYLFISSVFLLAIIFFNCLLRPTSNELMYIYNYLLYGAAPVFFLENVRNFKVVLKYYTVISIVVGFIYALDPFLDYHLSGGYMPYGFNVMLPACTGCVLLIYFYKVIRSGYILLCVFLILSLIFSNKGATIAALVILFYGFVVVDKYGKDCKKRLLLVLIFSCLLVSCFTYILDIAWELVKVLSIDKSYALATIQMIADGDGNTVFGTRYIVWGEALQLIRDNHYLGVGIGYFEKYSLQPYPHNFYLQVLVETGIVGGMFFIIMLFLSFFKLKKMVPFEKKIFTSLVFIQWFVSLSLSLSYWIYTPFWLYWALCFSKNKSFES